MCIFSPVLHIPGFFIYLFHIYGTQRGLIAVFLVTAGYLDGIVSAVVG